MKKLTLGLLAAGLAVTAACGSTPAKTPAAQITTTTYADSNRDGLVDGSASLATYCKDRMTSLAKGYDLDQSTVVAQCDQRIADGTVKDTDDVDSWRDNAEAGIKAAK